MGGYFTGTSLLAPAASTGNVTGTGYDADPAASGHAFQFVVEAIGATPTVTWKIQGSWNNSNWFDLLYVTDASDTAATTARINTVVGADIIFLSNPVARQYKYYRVVTTANTNVTFRCEVNASATN
jgi:hypothetical protein